MFSLNAVTIIFIAIGLVLIGLGIYSLFFKDTEDGDTSNKTNAIIFFSVGGFVFLVSSIVGYKLLRFNMQEKKWKKQDQQGKKQFEQEINRPKIVLQAKD